MTASLEQMLSNIETMSEDDLETLQKRISEKLNKKNSKVDLSKVGYRLSPNEIEARLAEFLTPEELADIDESELDDFPTLPKTITEYISEDREDRL